MRLHRALGALLAVGLAVAAAGGCSALVTSELEQVSCQQEGAIGPPACPVGQACRGGQCTSCAPKEVCANGADDDCNGKTDEGCEDAGTGGAGAGGNGGAGGSGATGGDPGGGTGGLPTGGGGSSGSGATGGTGGIDAGTGATGGTGGTGGSGTGGSTGIGSTCIDSTTCPSGTYCADPTWFGGTGSKVCTVGCCTSDSCGTGTAVCFPSVWGGGVCLPAASVGRGAVGTKTVGTACGADAECRSALCDVTCVDTCCHDSDCAGTDYCTRKLIKGTNRSAMLCGKPAGSKSFQSQCGAGSECLSNVCKSTPIYDMCSKPCCAKKDCSGLADWECVYDGGVRICGSLGPSGTAALGQPCTWGGTCQSAQCIDVGKGGFCTDSCCTDKDCGAGFGCKPLKKADNSIVLLCVPM